MADITWSLAELQRESGHAYTRQHFALMSRNGNIEGASKVGKAWQFRVSPKLRKWVKEARQKRQPVAKARKASRVPVATLKTVEVARLAGVSTRHAERLASSDLKQWRYQTIGKHHRFLDTPGLRKWCIQKKRHSRKWKRLRVRDNIRFASASPFTLYANLTDDLINLIRMHPDVEIPWKPELVEGIEKLHAALTTLPPSAARSRQLPA